MLSEVRAGNPKSVGDFWEEMSERGTPLVESIDDDPDHVLLTFLWRGDGQTENVVLFSPLTTRADSGFSADQLPRAKMFRLAETNIWYKTFAIRDDVRLSYYLSPNDTLTSATTRRYPEDWASLQSDPLNPDQLILPHVGEDWVRSIVNLPGAAPVPWIVPQTDVPRGDIQTEFLQSEHLGDERRFWVYTPPGYSTIRESYGLLVLFDGWSYAQMTPTTTTIENLLAAGRIDPMVVVMVDQRDRATELACYDPWNKFLTNELIPWVHRKYSVTTEAASTSVGGGSRGGLAAVCAAWKHSDVFGNVLSHSGYFTWDPVEETAAYEEEVEFEWIIRQIATTPKVDVRFVISVGKLELDHEFFHGPTLLQSNRHMRDILLAKGYDITYFETPTGHDTYGGIVTLPAGLIALAEQIRSRKSEPEKRNKTN
ncbi:MAG: alpha/beta hydrolase-fold protein [Woeseia sp.]